MANGPTWWDDLNDTEDAPPVETFVVQRVDTRNWSCMPVQIEADDMPAARVNMTLVIKRDNRKKHNTLEWFFRSFSTELGAEYGFTTGMHAKPRTSPLRSQHIRVRLRNAV